MAIVDSVAGFGRRIPIVRTADWFLRIPLAVIIIEQGSFKIPDFALQAEGYGLPLVIFGLTTFAELAGGLAILLGGFIRNNRMTDLLTRLGAWRSPLSLPV